MLWKTKSKKHPNLNFKTEILITGVLNKQLLMQDVVFRENSRNIKLQFCYFPWLTLPLTLT